MEGHLGCPENYSRVFCDSECMGQEGLPSTRARSHVVGSLPARPGHSRDTPVTETTWTYSRQPAEVTTLRLGTGHRPVFTNVSAAHDTVRFECLLMTSMLSTRKGIEGRRNLHRSSERRLLVCHRCLVVGAARRFRVAVPAAS